MNITVRDGNDQLQSIPTLPANDGTVMPVSVSSLPLPIGAASDAKQDLMIAAAGSIGKSAATARGAQSSFESIVSREGSQLTGTSVGANNATTAYTVGQSIGGIGPGANQAWLVETIAISSTKDVVVFVQRANANLIANGAASSLIPVMVGPTYGFATVPIKGVLREGESISFVLQTAVAQAASSSAPDFTIRAGFHGSRLTNDFAFESPKVMLCIGDSITNTTGPTFGSEFYHAVFQRYLWSQGKQYRRILKGDGGWKTSHALISLKRNLLDVPQADAILFMLGTNETALSDFQANFPSFLSYKKDRYPDAKMVVIGPPPRQDAIETSVLVPLRSYAQAAVSAESNVLYVSFAAAFSAIGDTNYITNDGTASGGRVHPNALGHAGMAAVLRDQAATFLV